MKVAVIGSRVLSVSDLSRYLPENTTEIVSGGEKGSILRRGSTRKATESS